jgi:hypothetical protein
MMFLVPPERRAGFIRSMRALGNDAAPVNFTMVGIESWRANDRRGRGYGLAGNA